MCILFVYTLLKVASYYYYLSVLSMSVMGLQKKNLNGGVGRALSIFFLDFWNYLTLQRVCQET